MVVVALEVGGRFSEETSSFIRLLAQACSRTAPAHLWRAAQAYIARWSALLTHAAQTAFANSVAFLDPAPHADLDGDTPVLSDLLHLTTEPPTHSRLPPNLMDFRPFDFYTSGDWLV